MGKFSRRSLLVGAGVVGGALATRYLTNETISFGTRYPTPANDPLVLNDASLLSPVKVSKHLTLEENPGDALVDALRKELAEAKSERRPFVASAARHSMGGQSLATNATAVTMDQEWLEADTQNGVYRVAAGTRWSTIIKRLDEIGFSPKVMQSNNDFGVASTFCVNAHGWPVPFSAAGSTVKSFRMMRHDGEMIQCSRNENADQFNLAMGGYGLSGIITDLDVEMVPNARLVPTFEQFPGPEFGTRFVEKLASDKTIQMAYGRLDVTIDGFFDEALMITYTPTDDQSDLPAASGSGFLSNASREIFRRQVGSDRVKSWRWFTETSIGPNVGGGSETTRNSLINEPVITLDDGDPNRTDILHEYFVSPDRFAEFVDACKDIIPSSYQELLNITLRFVDTDNESVLSYATEPRIAAVMLFSQEMSVRGEADMQRMTSALIERVLEIGGTYYLPYRLHATNGQFLRGYERAKEFAALKRRADPELVFTNMMWDRYMAHL
ncbi:MAG: FAD-binding oxidoreductase [Pseudomonadota bacterium]